MKAFVLFLIMFGSTQAIYAQNSSSRASRMSYDLAFATGSYNEQSYSELHFGVNFYARNWLNWRNAAFFRSGSDANQKSRDFFGLDTSLRYEIHQAPQGTPLGFHFYIGPGYRITDERQSGPFAETGFLFQVGFLGLGAGLKSIHYGNPDKDALGRALPSNDTVVFLMIALGGGF